MIAGQLLAIGRKEDGTFVAHAWLASKQIDMDFEHAPLPEVCEADFNEKILGTEETVLVVFWTPWSRPCEVLLSVLGDLVCWSGGQVHVVMINADENLALSVAYQIESIPTLVCFSGGYECDRIVGTVSREAILSRFKTFLKFPSDSPSSRQSA